MVKTLYRLQVAVKKLYLPLAEHLESFVGHLVPLFITSTTVSTMVLSHSQYFFWHEFCLRVIVFLNGQTPIVSLCVPTFLHNGWKYNIYKTTFSLNFEHYILIKTMLLRRLCHNLPFHCGFSTSMVHHMAHGSYHHELCHSIYRGLCRHDLRYLWA